MDKTKENIRIGSVVLLLYESKKHGSYKLGHVTSIHLDDQGQVHHCDVVYKIGDVFHSVNRAIQSLVLILDPQDDE